MEYWSDGVLEKWHDFSLLKNSKICFFLIVELHLND